MVSLSQVLASNAKIHDQLPAHLVAVFVGATSGIGEYTLKAFARRANQPRVYFIGRSEEAGDRIKSECEALNEDGKFTFIKSDVALLKNVDDVCKRIRDEETRINLLVLCQGTLVYTTETEEGLNVAASLTHYSRIRFAYNLLPLIQGAKGVRRVVSVFAGTHEGTLDLDDLQGRNKTAMARMSHDASRATFGLEALAKEAPEVGFAHVFPGFVRSGIARGTEGTFMGALKTFFSYFEWFLNMNDDECGERHLFLGTSERYVPREQVDGSGVKLADEVDIAMGSDGNVGSGVYSVDQYGETAGKKVIKILGDQRAQSVDAKMWELTMEDFKRITGSRRI